ELLQEGSTAGTRSARLKKFSALFVEIRSIPATDHQIPLVWSTPDNFSSFERNRHERLTRLPQNIDGMGRAFECVTPRLTVTPPQTSRVTSAGSMPTSPVHQQVLCLRSHTVNAASYSSFGSLYW